jgi:prolyl oligopeptidase
MIRQRLGTLWDYAREGVPIRREKTYFYSYNTGLQNQPVIYAQRVSNGEKKIVLDPNTLSGDGTVALSSWAPSRNAHYLGYAVNVSGSDWQEIRVRDVESLKDLKDTVRWAKFTSIAWTKDNRGFFYSRYAEPTADSALLAASKGQKLYYHKLGDPQSKDIKIWERPDEPEWYVRGEVNDDGQFLIITISEGTSPKNRLYFMDLDDATSPNIHNPVVKLIDRFDATYRFIDNAGDFFFVLTDLNAPRGKIVLGDVNQGRRLNPRVLVPETEDKIEDVELIGGHFIVNYLHNAHSVLRLFNINGRSEAELALPGIGTIGTLSGQPDEPELFYSFASYLQPPTIFRYMLDKKTSSVFFEPKLTFDPTSTRRARSSTRARMARRCRCSSPRRKASCSTARIPRCSTATAGSISRRCRRSRPTGSCGWSSAACTRWRTSAAAASSAKRGTRPRCSRRSRTCSMTSSRPPSIWWARSTPSRRSSRSRADRTAACSWAR